MDAFFTARIDTYDTHMRTEIEGAEEFYPFTASLLPESPGIRILDLGCGTGLELEPFFRRNPAASVTGIDLSQSMLRVLSEKFPGRDLSLICGSYLDLPLGEAVYDAAVSVESLHHFTPEQKQSLYRRLRNALKEAGFFVLTDFFAGSPAEETAAFEKLHRLKRTQGASEDILYHFDTPLTVDHELHILREAGFSRAEHLRGWGTTHTLLAVR